MGKLKLTKRTLSLDDVSIEALEEYGVKHSGSSNLSAAVRHIARDWKRRQTTRDIKDTDF